MLDRLAERGDVGVAQCQRFDIDVVVRFGPTRPRRRHPALRHRLAGGIVGVVHDRVSPRSGLIARNAVETGCCKAAPRTRGKSVKMALRSGGIKPPGNTYPAPRTAPSGAKKGV